MIRLILLIILFLLSLLTVFKAPAYYLWLGAILVSEFPLIFVSITTLITAWGIWYLPYQTSGTIVGLLAILLFLSPIFRAYIVAKDLKQEMSTAFENTNNASNNPFTLSKLFSFDPKGTYKVLNYKAYADITMTLDFYSAKAEGKRPCVLVVHGGSWNKGDSQQLPELNAFLAEKDYQVASISYRMAPKYLSPAPVEDVENALSYLRKHAEELNIDTSQFVLLGRSAGAQIALLAAYTLADTAIKGVIDFYAPADMVWGYSIPANPLVMDSKKMMEDYLGGKFGEVPKNYVNSSPIEFVNPQSPPTLIIHGANDVLVAYNHSKRLNEKLQQNKVKHYWLKLPWATHGFDYHLNGPGGQLSTFAVKQFLKDITKAESPMLKAESN